MGTITLFNNSANVNTEKLTEVQGQVGKHTLTLRGNYNAGGGDEGSNSNIEVIGRIKYISDIGTRFVPEKYRVVDGIGQDSKHTEVHDTQYINLVMNGAEPKSPPSVELSKIVMDQLQRTVNPDRKYSPIEIPAMASLNSPTTNAAKERSEASSPPKVVKPGASR